MTTCLGFSFLEKKVSQSGERGFWVKVGKWLKRANSFLGRECLITDVICKQAVCRFTSQKVRRRGGVGRGPWSLRVSGGVIYGLTLKGKRSQGLGLSNELVSLTASEPRRGESAGHVSRFYVKDRKNSKEAEDTVEEATELYSDWGGESP